MVMKIYNLELINSENAEVIIRTEEMKLSLQDESS
jgi:hypothetical protein